MLLAPKKVFLSDDSIPIAEQIKEENTKYYVLNDFDLQGQTVEIPKGSTLIFKKGGKLRNGILCGNETLIRSPKLDNIHFAGSFVNNRISISETAFGNEIDFWGILQSFQNATVKLDCDITPSSFNSQNIELSRLCIEGKGHTINVSNCFPIIYCPVVELSNISFNCSYADTRVLYIIGSGERFFVDNCSFTNIPEVDYLLCSRLFSNVEISNCSFEGTLLDNPRAKQATSCIMLYECNGHISVCNNSINNCFGIGICGLGFKRDKNSKIIIERNCINTVSNGGIAFSGGEVENVIIRKNIITNTHIREKQLEGEGTWGENSAINFHGFHNVIVEKNTIVDCDNSSCFDFDGSQSGVNDVVKGDGLVIQKNKCNNTGGIALFVVNDVLFENNIINAKDLDYLLAISGSRDIIIRKNEIFFNSLKMKEYPFFLQNIGQIHSGNVLIDNNRVASNGCFFACIDKSFSGVYTITESNQIVSSSNDDGFLLVEDHTNSNSKEWKKAKLKIKSND